MWPLPLPDCPKPLGVPFANGPCMQHRAAADTELMGINVLEKTSPEIEKNLSIYTK